jgi:3-hydroxybutyryl-CoA dehydrogenase
MSKEVIKAVGVVGAGVMGVGLAQNLAQTHHRVVLVDIDNDILSIAKENIRRNLRFSMMINPELKGLNIDTVLNHIQYTTDYQQLRDVEIVVENVTERWSTKETVYRLLDTVCKKDIIFAVNTSAISITKVASITQRPEKIVGMHFMNPVPQKSTVEVVQGVKTSQETISTAQMFLKSMNKKMVLVSDSPGFVTNRISHLFMNEAIWVVQDQVANPEQVDQLFKECYSHKIGPLETADLIGLDTVLDTLEVLYESYLDSKFRPAPLLRKMVDAGMTGRKAKKGFYEYS